MHCCLRGRAISMLLRSKHLGYVDTRMASKYPSGVHIPVRPAPAPPPNQKGRPDVNTSSKAVFDGWSNSFNDLYHKHNGSQRLVLANKPGGKKTPPPRPPPPKITFNQKNGRNQPQRPSQLLSSLGDLFSRDIKGNRGGNVKNTSALSSQPVLQPHSKNDSLSLIDLNSPPSSPTPTTRSSSDGLSVDSFGSDGTTSHSGRHQQHVESGFEDDFDFFSGFPSSSSSITPSPLSGPVDPFSPPKPSKSVSPLMSQSAAPVVPRPSIVSKPTIIRPKGKPAIAAKPANFLPKPFNSVVLRNSVQSSNDAKLEVGQSSYDSGSFEFESGERSPSPPMPSIPAPVLPPEVLAQLDNSNITTNSYGVALYDYVASHPDDLSFKEGDQIELVRKVNEEWLCGRLNGREGIFPDNFLQVVIPLPETEDDCIEEREFTATALYPFIAETWDDLDLKEGATVKILGRIDADWLYGECEGRRGQFPATFIDSVPSNLPIKSS